MILVSKYPFLGSLKVEGVLSDTSLSVLCSSIAKVMSLAPASMGMWNWVEETKYIFEDIPYGGLTSRGLIRLNPRGLTEWTVVHELGHAWDASMDWQLSERMRKATGSHFLFRPLHRWFPDVKQFWYHVGSPPAPCGVDKNFNAKEDFAEAVAAFVFPDAAHARAAKKGFSYESEGYIHFHATPRGKFIQSLL